MEYSRFDLIVIGGGAAGFFAAVAAKELSPRSSVLILEKSSQLLSKVRISGGGRCNVTHACFEPRELVRHYPRGEQQLIAPFSRFQPQDTMEWFANRGIVLKTEPDGRVFPSSNTSQTIIDCLLQEAKTLDVEIRLKAGVKQISLLKERSGFALFLDSSSQLIECERLIFATGSHPHGHAFATQLGHTICAPVPSLFTFNVPSSSLSDLAGIAVQEACVELPSFSLSQTGPLLITHWGFSGPAVLKLSAWGARLLHATGYRTEMNINWVPQFKEQNALNMLINFRSKHPNKTLFASNPFGLPKNLWKRFLDRLNLPTSALLSTISNQMLKALATSLTRDTYLVEGKTTHKEEFVTCGGVCLNEVNFKTMESRLCPGAFFAGEILDIDGVTGGFNFQNAWTTGWIAGRTALAGCHTE